MKKYELLAASTLALIAATPTMAQTAGTTSAQNTAPTNGPGQEAPSSQTTGTGQTYGADIVVTAQRQSQRLQDVPIAISAFTADNLAKQQIVNPLALQQSLPNVTFTKTNFTSSSFTIRGVGDLCVGASCDSATAIHVNDMPLISTRLFETEFFDLERVEVLRGPQGTLYGRNATSGVVNFITAKPDLSGIHAAGEFEYGNYNSKQVKGMLNVPLSDTIGVRVAGLYLNREGYTYNTYYNNRVDGRDLYSVRGTLSWEPTSATRVDLIGYYFHEADNRSRIQKQLCHRDPTGILGCLPDQLAYQTSNGNSTFVGTLTSREGIGIVLSPALAGLGLQSLYGPDTYQGVVNPNNVRTVTIDYNPTYFADEEQYMAKVFHDFGSITANFTGGYTRNSVDSTTDYNLAVENSLANNPGLALLNAAGRPGAPLAFLNGVRNTLIPNGPANGVCQSAADPNGVGVYGGNSIGCYGQSIDFDRSRQSNRQYSAELHLDTKFSGPINFLIGGIYVDNDSKNTDYFVNAFGIDYFSGILGSVLNAAKGGNAFAATPFSVNAGTDFRLKSYGIFGETYYTPTEKLKFTVGLRYSHDDKRAVSRNLIVNAGLVSPIGITNINQSPSYATFDFGRQAGINEYDIQEVQFSRLTGRAVVDYKITDRNLLYASYSRGYKSGGINPPVGAEFNVNPTFRPESIDAFEIGSKNTFGGGALRLNLTGFYYKYKDLQISRIIARTSVNDNISANIYGVEAEAVVSPVPAFVVNMNASYLHARVSGNNFFTNPRDVSGGRSDVVIIKDITNGSNCAVIPNTPGNAAGANALVGAYNAAVGLQGPTPVVNSGGGTTGAFSICTGPGSLASLVANPPTQARALFGTPTGPLPFTVADGAQVNINGNRLPQAPTYKFSVGAQYTARLSNDWTIVPRADLNYTGAQYASIFNLNVDKIQGYAVINAQVQVNAPNDRFYIRGFVQNLGNNNAITGQYVADQSSGLFTNIFTLEPRRYGIAAGFKF